MIQNILLEKIDADPNQPRQKFVASELAELKDSIKEKGILVPLVIESNYKEGSDHFLLLDGERRYRCSKELQLKDVPATITQGPLSHEERTVLRFHIQEQHKNWSIFDKARAIFDLKRSTKLSINEIAVKLNTSAPRIHNWLSMMDLTEESQKEIVNKKISFSFLIHLAKITKDYLSFSELSQREIEQKLIQKIEADTFKTTIDFQRFSRLMSSYEHYPEKLEFLNKIEMSLDQIFEKTKLNETVDLEIFYKSLVNVEHHVSEIINKKYELSQEYKDILKTINEKIKELL